MTSCAISLDLARHLRQLDEDEAREKLIDDTVDMLVQGDLLHRGYWREYMETGRVKDFDLDTEDLEVISQKESIDFKTIIRNRARELVEKDPGIWWV